MIHCYSDLAAPKNYLIYCVILCICRAKLPEMVFSSLLGVATPSGCNMQNSLTNITWRRSGWPKEIHRQARKACKWSPLTLLKSQKKYKKKIQVGWCPVSLLCAIDGFHVSEYIFLSHPIKLPGIHQKPWVYMHMVLDFHRFHRSLLRVRKIPNFFFKKLLYVFQSHFFSVRPKKSTAKVWSEDVTS